MRVYDISYPLGSETPIWPGDPPVAIMPHLARSAGASSNTSLVIMGSHAGTHVDAPAHLFAGRMTVDKIALDDLVGPAHVIDCRGTAHIDAAFLNRLTLDNCVRLLFHTAGQPDRQHGARAGAVLTPEAANWLCAKHIRLVGISSPSVDPADSEELPVHRALLASGVVIIENLLLDEVPAGEYLLVCLPLALAGADAAPARVVLIDARYT